MDPVSYLILWVLVSAIARKHLIRQNTVLEQSVRRHYFEGDANQCGVIQRHMIAVTRSLLAVAMT